MNDSSDEQQLHERVRRLEERIAALESALAVLGENSGQVTQKMSLAQTLKLAILGTPPPVAPAPVALPTARTDAPPVPAARPPVPAEPANPSVATSPAPFAAQAALAATAPAAALPAAPATRPVFDQLNMTDAFASLDLRVAEAAAAESSLGRANSGDKGMVEIDATLIDKAFARPPPEKLHVRAAIEELHPKIAERVVKTWRTAELLQYLKKLIVDERGDRAGFAPAVMSELLLLSAILEAPEEKDAWASNARPV